jgi:hypothetical protein
MIDINAQLEHVGDALQNAWREDHARHRATLRVRRPRRLVLTLALVAAIVGGGAAIAAEVLKSAAQEQQGIVEGYQLFEGSSPTCTPLTATSFRCTLGKPPTGMTFYDEQGRPVLDRFLGLKAETVDSTRHVDGACVSIANDGRLWQCYLGQEAVDRGILNQQLLGRYEPQRPTA